RGLYTRFSAHLCGVPRPQSASDGRSVPARGSPRANPDAPPGLAARADPAPDPVAAGAVRHWWPGVYRGDGLRLELVPGRATQPARGRQQFSTRAHGDTHTGAPSADPAADRYRVTQSDGNADRRADTLTNTSGRRNLGRVSDQRPRLR